MTDDAVERVAKAIFVGDYPSGHKVGRWGEVSQYVRDNYLCCARAAISAMTPTVAEAAKVLVDALSVSDDIDEDIVDMFYDGEPMTALRALSEGKRDAG